uniref:(northern house mosquito) hypothetical protein n=1 Tax=Culex pipiens TaxID=7175 RepID=A0A8D8L5V4_CULPI
MTPIRTTSRRSSTRRRSASCCWRRSRTLPARRSSWWRCRRRCSSWSRIYPNRSSLMTVRLEGRVARSAVESRSTAIRTAWIRPTWISRASGCWIPYWSTR